MEREGPGLPDVGMVQMYSKSVNVNDLGYAWTGWPSSLLGLALFLVSMVFPPGVFLYNDLTHCPGSYQDQY